MLDKQYAIIFEKTNLLALGHLFLQGAAVELEMVIPLVSTTIQLSFVLISELQVKNETH